MTDSMNFGPDWIRNLSSEGSTGGGSSSGTRYQLADYRYGREEMLALFDKNIKPPASLSNFKSLYADNALLPLALVPTSDEERVAWQGRPTTLAGPPRGRGGPLERGGRGGRGRGGYQSYGRPSAGYDSGWGNGEQPDWSPRKEYNARTVSLDNWRRSRNNDDDDTWRNMNQTRNAHEKWTRQTSWRGEGDSEERTGPPERGGRPNWTESGRGGTRRSWDNEDHLPEWATENPTEGGGTFDERGAFHGSDDEQLEGKPPNRRDLQKSTSQQHITNKSQHASLPSSKSTNSLIKPDDHDKRLEDPKKDKQELEKSNKENGTAELDKPVLHIPDKTDKEPVHNIQDRLKLEGPSKINEKVNNTNGQDTINRVEDDLERLHNVLKFVDDEESPKPLTANNYDVASVQPPPNLVPPPIQDKWYYQDPQGQTQGPFPNMEMAEWYKAGYFSNQLKVRRQCDERFFLLGELINICSGANPFQAGIRFPVLKHDINKLPEQDVLQYQYLQSHLAAIKQAQARAMSEPWSGLTLQQQELAAQRLMLHQQQQLPQDLQFMQQPPPTNPLMQMINQMQQANKLPVTSMVEKPNPSIPSSIDPLIQMQMANLHPLQTRIPTANMPSHLPTGLPTSLSASLPSEGMSSALPNLQPTGLGAAGLPIPGMSGSLPGNLNIPRPSPHPAVDPLSSNTDNDPISSLLKQLQQQKQQSQQIDSLWQQNQYNQSPLPPHWQASQDMPMSLWDMPQSGVSSPVMQRNSPSPAQPPQQQQQQQQIQQPPPEIQQLKIDEKEHQLKEELAAKELKKKKEQEEKQAKKDAEEKRKQEQRKMEAEKKVAEEKRRKEEEKIKKELEKAKKEAEEKRMRELEEKRRLKEQRKAEEEARKKSEEQKKLEEERERQRREREVKEMEERKQSETMRQMQERIAKTAPWSQSGSSLGLSLADIQKAEKEKKAQETAIQLQKQQLQVIELQLQQQQQQQQQMEKAGGIQLSWAKKPVEPRKVKSLAEIQAEEQERLAKQAAEARLQKEKEPPVVSNVGNIWNGQSLSWANTSNSNSQWSSSGGFWDEPTPKPASKPSALSKSSSAINSPKHQAQPQPQPKQNVKTKPKKEEMPTTNKVNHNNNHGPTSDEFFNWCFKSLSNMSTDVDVPTFVTFLRDLESAMEVREYCKEYLGDSTATQQFASNFLEKRRSFRPKSNAHKDDMCSPAPAITPSVQHCTEFQEVKGKNKKNKKSKMLKVDSRILGFNVTSAPDRINVGDRDYGDNS